MNVSPISVIVRSRYARIQFASLVKSFLAPPAVMPRWMEKRPFNVRMISSMKSSPGKPSGIIKWKAAENYQVLAPKSVEILVVDKD